MTLTHIFDRMNHGHDSTLFLRLTSFCLPDSLEAGRQNIKLFKPTLSTCSPAHITANIFGRTLALHPTKLSSALGTEKKNSSFPIQCMQSWLLIRKEDAHDFKVISQKCHSN